MTKAEIEALNFAKTVAIYDRDALLAIEPKRKRLARCIEYKGHRFCLLYDDLKTFCKLLGNNEFMFRCEGVLAEPTVL